MMQARILCRKENAMDIQKFLQEKGSGLAQKLTTQVGLAPQTAQSFLSQLAPRLVDTIRGGGVDLKAVIGGGDVGALLGKLNLGQIARTIGIDEAKATAGAKAVIPGLIEGLQKQAGGIGGVIGNVAGGASDILKKGGGMFPGQS
jgi:uncharacterized protein YidB (DUF937 family)